MDAGLVLSLLAPLVFAQTEPAPPPSPPKSVEETRAAHLATDRERCAAIAEAMDRFGHVDEFAAKARALLAAKDDRFIKTKDGWFTDIALERWLEWNVPAEGSTTLPAMDLKAPGHPFGAIVDLNRQLHEHGIDLLIVTFPTRPELYPELMIDLPSLDGFVTICPGSIRFILALIDAGVDVLYLTPEFVEQRYGPGGSKDDQLFLKSNQHWTPRGAELGAKLTAERIAKYPWFTPGPAKEGVDFVVGEKETSISIVWGGKPKDAEMEHYRVHTVTRPDKKRIDYVRPSSPIALLSGSFADFHKVSDCDYTSHLYRFLGWPLDKINPKGGVESAGREALAKRSPEELAKKKLVVWMLVDQAFNISTAWHPVTIFGE